MKTVVILQSNYLPWKGYFDLIHDADLFVFYDDVQYTSRDWRNRNKIKTPNGTTWITVPTGSNRGQLICDVQLDDSSWQEKHWKSIVYNYSKSPHYSAYESFFRELFLGKKWGSLSEFNHASIIAISKELLGISTEFNDSRNYGVSGQKEMRILNLAKAAGADCYLSGPAAKNYLEPQLFDKTGIQLAWKDYSGYPEYPQRYPPFDHSVSILDLLFNVGPDAPWYIWGWREEALSLP